MLGSELALSADSSSFERLYIRLFGVPISGLRIRLRRVLPRVPPDVKEILDAGCGRGVFSIELAKRHRQARVTGIDLDPVQIEKNTVIAREAGLDNLEFRCENVAELPFENAFDCILSVDNLEHIDDDRKALDSLVRALRPGGRLVVHVPGYERRWFLFRFRTNFDVPGHYRPGYYIDEIRDKIRQAGMVVDEAYYTFGWLETVTNNISYAITRAEARNKVLYALVFPVINCLAWLGRNSRPDKGAGVLLLAHKPGASS